MPSSVRPSDFQAVIPSVSSGLCEKFKLVLITLPRLLSEFFSWALNSDGSLSDAFLADVNSFSSGDLKWSASPVIPANDWLLCEGQAVSRTTYAALFAAIGTTYGAGDSSTTFNVPDGRGLVLLGVGTGASGTSYSLGDTGGIERQTLNTGQLPSHTHSQNEVQIANAMVTGGGTTIGVSSGVFTLETGATGSGESHENRQPFLAAYLLIKV